MRNRFTILLFLFIISAQGQNKSWNNWYFGYQLGMGFNSGPRTIKTDNKVYVNYGAACISDELTGDFLFMTDGKKCYDRNFDAMSIDMGLTTPVFSFIVPDPKASNKYLVFVVDNTHTIFYCHVDMSLRGGLGDVTSGIKQLRSNADHHFTFVRRSYDKGLWMITHTMGSDEFQVFAITELGINLNPIVSKLGKVTSDNKNYVHGNMVSDNAGKTLVHCASGSGDLAFAQIFDFDKKCGTLTYRAEVYPYITQGIENFCHAAFSNSGKFLYVSWYGPQSTGGHGFYQYNLSYSQPDVSRKFLGSAYYTYSKIALAPDGLIYASSSDNGNVTSKVSLIEYADTDSAKFVFNAVDLKPPGTGYHFVENWPPFIMDRNLGLDTSFEKPQINISGACLGNDVKFEVVGNFQYDSLEWDIGTGGKITQRDFSFLYLSAGEYEISFSWYLCGFKYTQKEKLKVIEKPYFNLGADTVLCAAAEMQLQGSGADEYLWSTGETGNSITIKEAGSYWLRAGTDYCYHTDTVEVEYFPSLAVELGADYWICEDREDMVKLDAGKGFIAYKWTPTGDSTQWIIVKKTGDYFVVVEDFRGCRGEDGTSVKRRCPLFLEMPNSFSPNNDGLNDFFKPVYTDVESYELYIYNRWGEEIFSSSNPEMGWSGRYNGNGAPVGVYLYRLQYSGYLGGCLRKFTDSGTFHLLR